MLRITLFEFVFRGIPELVLFILAAYIFSRTKIQKKDFIIAILVSNVGVFLIRNLPIGYGVHTIVSGITIPNTESISLHEKFGFKKIAEFEEIGFKNNKWLNVGYWQKLL